MVWMDGQADGRTNGLQWITGWMDGCMHACIIHIYCSNGCGKMMVRTIEEDGVGRGRRHHVNNIDCGCIFFLL